MSTRARVTKQVNTRIRGGKHLSGGPAGSTDPRGSVRSEAVGPDAVRRVPLGFRRVGEPARQRNKFPCSALASFREQAKGEDDVTEEAVRQYYDSHPEQFTRPERISASHILARERTAADAMLAELRNGADFATLAQDRSQDEATRDRAGRIFVILRGQMTPEFEAAAFALEPGGISDVVRDKDGYHLIQLHERVPAAVIPFETAKEKLRQRLAFERGQARLKQILAELEKQAKIEVDEAALAGIR